MTRAVFVFGFACYLVPSVSVAQSRLSGGFETNTIFYNPDPKTGALVPEGKVGSNNYFKLDYTTGKFKAGVQYEAYLPVLQGLPSSLVNTGLVTKYASFQDSSFSVTVGDFYEQFGNGLILRSFEERAIGLNTSLEGVRLQYNFKDIVRVKALLGRPREFMERSQSTVRGGSVQLDLTQLVKVSGFLEASYVNRFVPRSGQADTSASVRAYSFRANLAHRNWIFQTEYAYKTKDASVYNDGLAKDGSALLAEVGYARQGFGGQATFRRLEYMEFGASRGIGGIGRDLNYLPSLTRQHSLALANLQPYNTMSKGEIGVQVDIWYRLKRGSVLGGKYGGKLAFNASSYYALAGSPNKGYSFLRKGSTRYYQEANLELEKRVNARLNLAASYINQAFNPIVVGKENEQQKSVVWALTTDWRATEFRSFRLGLQHLSSRQYHKNWFAATLEHTVAPAWAFFVSDMYNYGDTRIHYFNGGLSYSAARSRIALNYGRNREGVVCVGGICLLMPAYTGLNLSVTSSF